MSLLPPLETRRPLWMALAHCIALAKPGTQRMTMLNYLYIAELSPSDKLRCVAEIRECKAARRGERLAVVS